MEIDVHFVRKSVRAIGKIAIKIEVAARDCINVLLELVATKVNYIVQEATVVIRNIFRKYPNRYESVISTLCEHLDSLDEPEAKAAMIWIIGQYADRIENSDVLLDDFLCTFAEETVEVQLALLTATVKLFIQRPIKGQELVPKVLRWATENTDNPDLRDRGFMYWRLLSTDPQTAKLVVMGEKPAIMAESEQLDPALLQQMCLHVGTLATIYLKPVLQVFKGVRVRKLQDSPALQKHLLPTSIAKRAQLEASGQGIPSKEGLREAINTADAYFASVTNLRNTRFEDDFGALSVNDDQFGGSPTSGEQQYVVNQYNPEQVYQPQDGGNNGDLLM